MADIKISALPDSTTPLDGTETLPIVQSGVTKRTSIASVLTSVQSAGTTNGVTFLNGSKVLSSAPALTFDGTYLTANGLRLSGSDVGNTIYKASGGFGISTGSTSGITFSTNLVARYVIDAIGVAIWSVSGSERMRLDTNGNLLIGVASVIGGSAAKLQVSSSTNAALLRGSAATSSVASVWNSATSGDNIFVDFATETLSTNRGSISYNRGAGLVAYNVTSDYRSKDIIGPVVDSGALIDSVPVYIGKMKGASQERPMFIAHEVPAYAHTGEKDAVDANGNPVYQQMDASALVPVMWAEIQSLRTRLAAAGI